MKIIFEKSGFRKSRGRFLTRAAAIRFICVCALSIGLAACSATTGDNADGLISDHGAKPAISSAEAARKGEDIIKQHLALDTGQKSLMKIRAKIEEAAGAARDIQMNIYRKREPDGALRMLIEFVSPSQEKDRSALVTVGPKGEVEATRYAQSTDAFVSSTDVAGEDSLFGMTLQELADGQPQKYNFTFIGEETVASKDAYRVEGTIKEGDESKFPRLVMLISKENSTMLQAEFYDRQNELIRRITVDETEQVAGHWTRMRWVVDNKARQKTIDFKVTDAQQEAKFGDSIFTREHLKKIASR